MKLHSISKNIFTFKDYFTLMDSDPQCEVILIQAGFLNGFGTVDSIRNGGKAGQYTITDFLQPSSFELLNQGSLDLTVFLE